MITREEFSKMEQETNCWVKLVEGSQNKIEYEWLACNKVWDLIEDTTSCNRFPRLEQEFHLNG
jgi:hypothetical protein